jgi:hypothetical protein
MRIPTILVLILLIFAISLGIALQIGDTKLSQEKKTQLIPIDELIVNISDHSATITWQTKIPSVGKIMDSKNNITTSDDRGSHSQLTHFVTLKNLLPNTLYTYQIINDDQKYPDSPKTFKTGPNIPNPPSINNFPVLGTILGQNLQPIDEALVFLTTEGNTIQGTYASVVGNFLLSLSDLRTADLNQSVSIDSETSATLTIKKDNQKSEIKIKVPLGNTYLPSIQLGQNLDLTNYQPPQSTYSASLDLNPAPKASPRKFDLNNDNKINAVDLSVLVDYIKTKKYVPLADFNNDRALDQKDVDLLKPQVQ